MHILLVEDKRADAELLSARLSAEGQVVHWVQSGYQAMDFVAQRKEHEHAPRPDMVILDLGLPRIVGYEALKQINHTPRAVRIPVVILTTTCHPLSRAQCSKFGADAFIVKPHNPEGYEVLIRQIIRFGRPHVTGRRPLRKAV